MARFSHWRPGRRAVGQPQAGARPGGRVRDRPGRNGARRRRAREADGRGPARARRGSCSRCGATAVASEPVREAIAGRTEYRAGDGAAFGLPELGLAETLRDGEESIESFVRARDHDLPAARRDRDGHAVRARRRAASTRSSRQLVRERHGREMFSDDGSSIDDQVAACCAGRRSATAESCTGGLLAARLTERPGSSEVRRWAGRWRTRTRRRWSCSAWIRR